MVDLVDVKVAITALLRSKYPRAMIYFDHIDKAKMPYFYVEFTAVKNTAIDEFSAEKLIQIDVAYCPASKRECNRNDLFLMGDELDQTFRPVLCIQDRFLSLLDTETKIHDDVLHYIFDLDFADAFEVEETHELMQNLNLEWR